MNDCPYGFRIVGSCRETRRLVDATAAFAGYARCDARAEINSEAYLSAFQFDDAFRQYLAMTNSTKGYNGPCWASWLWWDIDRENDIDAATRDARRLASMLVDRYRLDDNGLLIFFSGSKGFHVGLPSSLWNPEPSATFHRTSRQYAEHLADVAKVEIDVGVYDKVRAFRAPNSRHPKTGLHKRHLSLDELLHLRVDAIVKLAASPEPFDLPSPPPQDTQAVADWQNAMEYVEQATAAHQQRRQPKDGATLNRATLEFIRDGATVGDRHRLLYSAAANLAEFGCSPALAQALLADSGLDSGLAPREVRRQIDCGLKGGAE